MDRVRWVLGLGGLSVACVVMASAVEAAPRPAPTPTPKTCRVIPDPGRSTPPPGGAIVVVIPRTNCSPGHAMRPTPQPVQQPGIGVGGVGRPGGGGVPFTGADIARWSALAGAFLAVGAALVTAGRRRRAV